VWLDVAPADVQAPASAEADALRTELTAFAEVLERSAADDAGRRVGVVFRGAAGVDVAEDAELRALVARLVGAGLGLGVDIGHVSPASLATLLELPLESLWVPAVLLHSLPGRGGSAAVVKAMATMAHDLGIEVVVDGADTEAVAAAMTELGFRRATGAPFGGPLSAERFAGLLWASVGAYQAERWNTASGERLGRPDDVDGGSSRSGSPTRTAPT
jgi:EAL domain-containing protein (putative c-di-GMP-specific phosphodiesterase class I)